MIVPRAEQKSDTTPPGSFVKLLTPPLSEQKFGSSVQQIIDEIEARRTGRGCSSNPWQRYRLSQAAYEHLEKGVLSSDFVQDKIGFDYFPSKSLFILRMHSAVHEHFKSSVVQDIIRQLDLVAKENGEEAEFARRIKHAASTTIKFSELTYGQHDPDASFQHREAKFPGVIIEVSYTQKRKDLARLAQDYILGSSGNIRVVVGLDIEYKGKSATLLIWEPHLQENENGEKELTARQTLSNQEFRKENGQPTPGTGLRLHLEDFAPAFLSKHKKFGRDIFIPSTSLCAYLHDAEQEHMKLKENRGYEEPLGPGVKRRRQSSSSAEQLNTDDELQFQQKEERDAKRVQRADEDYEDR